MFKHSRTIFNSRIIDSNNKSVICETKFRCEYNVNLFFLLKFLENIVSILFSSKGECFHQLREHLTEWADKVTSKFHCNKRI